MNVIRAADTDRELIKILHSCDKDPVFPRRGEKNDAVVLSMAALEKLLAKSGKLSSVKTEITNIMHQSMHRFGAVYESLAALEQQENSNKQP